MSDSPFDQSKQGSPSPASAQDDLALLIALKNFAVRRGYDLDDSLLEKIDALHAAMPAPDLAKQRSELDKLIIQLSKITYPVTISNVADAVHGKGMTAFVYVLMAIGALAAVFAGFLIWAISKAISLPAAGTGLALSLGFVGAIVYVMLPDGKLNLFAGLDAENRASNIVRVCMGGLLGFVLSLIVAPIGASLDPKQLIVPLVGGYSITLVVGILAKAVAAVELTFNIDDKAIRSSLRK